MLSGPHTIRNWKMELMHDKLERILKEVIMAYRGTIVTFDKKDWDKPWNNSVRITGVLADSWTGHFANTT